MKECRLPGGRSKAERRPTRASDGDRRGGRDETGGRWRPDGRARRPGMVEARTAWIDEAAVMNQAAEPKHAAAAPIALPGAMTIVVPMLAKNDRMAQHPTQICRTLSRARDRAETSRGADEMQDQQQAQADLEPATTRRIPPKRREENCARGFRPTFTHARLMPRRRRAGKGDARRSNRRHAECDLPASYGGHTHAIAAGSFWVTKATGHRLSRTSLRRPHSFCV